MHNMFATRAGRLRELWLPTGLRRNRITVNGAIEMESLETVASMVAHNLGVSIVPNICVPDQIFAGLRKLPLPGKAVRRGLGVLTRSDCTKMRLVEGLLQQINETVSENTDD